MIKIRDPQMLLSQGAIELLEGLEPHLPISTADLCDCLQAGLLPAQAGDEFGRRLSANWQALLDELNRITRTWQNRADSYRLAWEACQKSPANMLLAEAKSNLDDLGNRLRESEHQQAVQNQRLHYLERENERLNRLVDDQQAIIAEQQLQLAQMDESSFDV